MLRGTTLEVVAAAVVRDRRLLVVSKRAAPDVFYLPGGKPDPGEDPVTTLRRELREELEVELTAIRPFAEVEDVAALERTPMRMTVYLAELAGQPRPAAELAAISWVTGGRAEPVLLAPAVRNQVVPQLREAGLLGRR